MADEQSNPHDHLEPPVREGQTDPGAHDLSDASADESEDHFSDARSDILSPAPKSAVKSKFNDVPKTKPETPKTESETPKDEFDEASKTVSDDTSSSTPPATVANNDVAKEVPIKVDTSATTLKVVSETENIADNKSNDEPKTVFEGKLESKSEAILEPELQVKAEPEPEEEPEVLVEPMDTAKSDVESKPKEVTTIESASSLAKSHDDPEPEPESEIQLSFKSEEPQESKAVEQLAELTEELEGQPEEPTVATEESLHSPLPGGFSIPITVLEESSGSVPPRSPHVEHTHATDASPDLVLRPKDEEVLNGGAELPKLNEEAETETELPQLESEELEPQPDINMPTLNTNVKQAPTSPLASPLEPPKSPKSPRSPKSPNLSTPSSPRLRRKSSRHMHSPIGAQSLAPPIDDADDFDDDFGDFDDFEEGGDDDDFGDFDDAAFQTEPVAASTAMPAPVSPAPVATTLPFPVPDFEGLDEDDVPDALDPYMNLFFPPENLDVIDLPPLTKENTSFLTQRSASLWSQLVAPPPLAPPDWIRSRIRRLFLVSLGVPVDLDEILPASKQKKLVLPSLSAPSGKSSRTSSDSRAKKTDTTAAASSTSSGTHTPITAAGRRRGEKATPTLDLVSAKQLCAATDEALAGMTMDELQEHLAKLQALQGEAGEALEYWTKTTDEKIAERDALEGVIENLVKHARKVRK